MKRTDPIIPSTVPTIALTEYRPVGALVSARAQSGALVAGTANLLRLTLVISSGAVVAEYASGLVELYLASGIARAGTAAVTPLSASEVEAARLARAERGEPMPPAEEAYQGTPELAQSPTPGGAPMSALLDAANRIAGRVVGDDVPRRRPAP